MPLGRYPGRVGPFQKWALQKTKDAEISDSATPGSRSSRGRKWRLSRRKRKKRRKE